MFQEENKLNSFQPKTSEINTSNKKNDRQWKRRVNLFRLVYAYLITNNNQSDSLIQSFLDDEDDDVSVLSFKEQKELLQNIINNYAQYKQTIEQYLKKGWVFDRLSVVDQALFLCALAEYEVIKTPKKIIVDQTIVTAKRYSSANAYKYINAILDKVLVNDEQTKK